jgi:protease-4
MEIQRESIFISSLRIFCRSAFGLLGLGFGLLILMIGAFFLSSPFDPPVETSIRLLPDLNDRRDMAPHHSPVVLQIDLEGVVGMTNQITTEQVREILMGSREGIFSGNRVKAVLLRMNTPGGTVDDSDNIYRMLLDYKQRYDVPIYAYVDGLCASGGMYISSAADQIYASPPSVVGSIGVILSTFFNVTDLMKTIGVQAKTLKEGIDKDMMSPFRPWQEGEDASLKKIIQHLYNQFVDVMTSGRPQLNRTELVNTYGAQVFDGPSAVRIGMIDQANSSYKQTLSDLMQAAHINPEEPYQVVSLSLKADLLSGWMEKGGFEVKHTIDLLEGPKLKNQFAYLYLPNG